jgi:hypothetical protein
MDAPLFFLIISLLKPKHMKPSVNGVYHARAHKSYQSINYEGNLQEIQLQGNTFKNERYSRIEHQSFTVYQNLLYNRALYGLAIYTKEEIKNMHWEKRKRIKKINNRVQETINILKQERNINWTNNLLKVLNKNRLVEEIIANFSAPDKNFINHLTFKELGLTKKDIIDKLIEVKALPYNFYDLKNDPNIKLTN